MADVAAALQIARERGLDRLDAQRLLGHVLGRSRSWLLAHGEVVLDAPAAVRYAELLDRLGQGEPLAYLLGSQGFHGLELTVNPAVLIPRPDTETLVDWALQILGGHAGAFAAAEPDVLDLGTGSGAVALAIRQSCPAARVHAVDASPEALAVARDNGRRLGLEVDWQLGDWWTPWAGRRFDLVVGNPPYIALGDPHLDALSHEPGMALRSGPDGLDAIRQIAAGAGAHLRPGAWLLLEHGWDQAAAAAAILSAHGLQDVTHRTDLNGHLRCTGAQWPGRPGRPDRPG